MWNCSAVWAGWRIWDFRTGKIQQNQIWKIVQYMVAEGVEDIFSVWGGKE